MKAKDWEDRGGGTVCSVRPVGVDRGRRREAGPGRSLAEVLPFCVNLGSPLSCAETGRDAMVGLTAEQLHGFWVHGRSEDEVCRHWKGQRCQIPTVSLSAHQHQCSVCWFLCL